jgi:nucleoid-associated protein YgaU
MEEAKRNEIERMMKEDHPHTSVKYIAEHTVTAGETLGDISLKYYGSAVKDKWMMIYEANKAVIGDNPNKIRPGQVLKIPELPKE